MVYNMIYSLIMPGKVIIIHIHDISFQTCFLLLRFFVETRLVQVVDPPAITTVNGQRCVQVLHQCEVFCDHRNPAHAEPSSIQVGCLPHGDLGMALHEI